MNSWRLTKSTATKKTSNFTSHPPSTMPKNTVENICPSATCDWR